MDPLGTKKLIAIVEQATGVIVPQTQANLVKLATALDGAGIFFGEMTDLVKDADKIVEAFPEQWQAMVKGILGLMDHFVRVGTQVSNATQDAQKTSAEARELLKAIHERGFRLTIPEEVGP